MADCGINMAKRDLQMITNIVKLAIVSNKEESVLGLDELGCADDTGGAVGSQTVHLSIMN